MTIAQQTPTKPLDRAVFLDRDGTLIVDTGYPRDPAEVRLIPGAAAALLRFRERGFRLVVVSNQSGIARGVVTEEQARSVHDRFVGCLAAQGVVLDGVYYCPHGPDGGCDCRKPRPGLLRRAAEELGLDLERSFAVGDLPRDVEAGVAAGCRAFLLRPVSAAGWETVVKCILDAEERGT
jgi:histidinol-phosphate phosphatase family protein